MQPLDDLLPANTTIVVLDTSPARNLGYANDPPPWVETFVSMKKRGYSFSLADNAFAELLSQMMSQAMGVEQAARMLKLLKAFLNPDLPILPGKSDLYALIGSNERASDWSVGQVRSLSIQAWDVLNCSSSATEVGLSSVENELQSEREAWFAIFETLGKRDTTGEPLNEYEHSQLTIALTSGDSEVPELSPLLSVRWDLQMRLLWRQYVRSKKTSEPYDPTSRKKRNDGIDFDLFHYFLLPAFVVATDSGFFEKLVDINSYQKAWFWKPEALAQAWANGERPRPIWP